MARFKLGGSPSGSPAQAQIGAPGDFRFAPSRGERSEVSPSSWPCHGLNRTALEHEPLASAELAPPNRTGTGNMLFPESHGAGLGSDRRPRAALFLPRQRSKRKRGRAGFRARGAWGGLGTRPPLTLSCAPSLERKSATPRGREGRPSGLVIRPRGGTPQIRVVRCYYYERPVIMPVSVSMSMPR